MYTYRNSNNGHEVTLAKRDTRLDRLDNWTLTDQPKRTKKAEPEPAPDEATTDEATTDEATEADVETTDN